MKDLNCKNCQESTSGACIDHSASIPSPFKLESEETVNVELMDKIKALAGEYGYDSFFIAIHQKQESGCKITTGTTFKGRCLLDFLKDFTQDIEDSDNGVEQ